VINTFGQPLFAIELDGKSHTKATRTADELKDRLFAAASLHLYRIKTNENFQTRIAKILSDLNLA
jgi:very-short-patch-repair endonuclease